MNIGKKIRNIGIMMEAPYLFGLKLRGYPWEMIKELSRKVITDSQIKTVIDVGSNVGQFATAIMNVLPEVNVYSFEPLLNCYKHLEKICQQNKRLRVYNIAIGDQKGRIEFFENQFSRSSSILKMLDLHKQEFHGTGKENRVEVEIDTLDRIFLPVKHMKQI
jgi:FkbM family methyltransferase